MIYILICISIMLGIKKKRFVYIDSAKRKAGTSSNFIYELNIPSNEAYDMCTVLQADIPLSYYLITSGNNTFQLEETGYSAVTVTIPEGNYSIRGFSNKVGSLLTSASPTLSSYTISFPNSSLTADTTYLTIEITGGSATDSKLIFSSDNNVNQQFGFASGATVTFSGTELVSTKPTDFQKNRSLLIHSDMVDGGSTNVLQEIYSKNTITNGYISYQSSDAMTYAKPLSINEQNTISIYISDLNGNAIDLNDRDLTITLLFFQIRKTFELIEKFIKFASEKIENLLTFQKESSSVQPIAQAQKVDTIAQENIIEEDLEKQDIEFDKEHIPLDYKSNFLNDQDKKSLPHKSVI